MIMILFALLKEVRYKVYLTFCIIFVHNPLAHDCGIFTMLLIAFHSQGVSRDFSQDRVYKCCGGYEVCGRIAHMMWKANEL